ncbi:MAG: methyltransferase domain-containing protein [Thermoanaerobaculia bacterium]
MLVCVACRRDLVREPAALRCSSCGVSYPVRDDIADFSGGKYYDSFHEDDELREPHARGLEHEVAGAETRARYYAKLIPKGARVLDCGAGNGLTVEHLRAAGFEAWGNDSSALRKWQWRERSARDHLVVADGAHLPFPDGFFEAVICSGVLEHIGVDEMAVPHYRVTPRATRDDERATFIRELLRVVAPGGSLFLDFPNGAFPIDFWHGSSPAAARFHRRDEGFLPAMPYLKRLFGGMRVTALGPHGRLKFRQVSGRWYGRVFSPLMRLFFAAMDLPVLRSLAGSPLNPFLVVKVQASDRARTSSDVSP